MAYPVVKVVTLKDSLLSKHDGTRLKNGVSARPRFKQSSSATTRFASNYNHIPMKKSPYLGYLRHAPAQKNHQNRFHYHPVSFHHRRYNRNHNSFLAEKSSPYVGFMRHAPPSSCQVNASKFSHNLRRDLIKLLDADYAHHPKKVKRKLVGEHNHDHDVLMKMRYREMSNFISGRLPGGGNLQSYYSFCKIYIESESPTIRRRSQENNDLQATFEMFHRLASWFLFPVAYDQRSTCSFSDLRDDAYMEQVEQGLSLISSLIKRILPGRDTLLICTGLKMEGDSLIPQSINSGIMTSDSDITIEDFEENNNSTIENDADDNAPSLSHNHPHHVSVSSLAKAYHLEQAQSNFFNVYSAEDIAAMSSAEIQRHLDVESILKLPTITYMSSKKEGTADGGIDKEEVPKDSKNDEEEDKKMDLEWSWISVPQHAKEGNINDEHCSNQTDINLNKNDQGLNLNEAGQNNYQQLQNEEHCVICLEKFQDGDRLRVLPCDHRFHTSCIDKWLSGSFSHEDCYTGLCPTCKKKPNVGILSNSPSFEVGEDDSMGTMGEDMRIEGIVPLWAFTKLAKSIANDH